MLLFEYRDFMKIHDYLIYKLDRKRILFMISHFMTHSY